MNANRELKVYFVIGEESGDLLGADLLGSLRELAGIENLEIVAHGLAGTALRSKGVNPLFDLTDIAVMGFSDVILRLPTIISRIYRTVNDILRVRPDVVVLIDSPDFTHAVAKRVRRKWPDAIIINYVCPSVWAWRKYRARKMTGYIDHVLTLLPFEPEKLNQLGGPPGTYVGHPLAELLGSGTIAEKNSKKSGKQVPDLLILPGSRKGEISRHMQVMGETMAVLRKRGVEFNPVVLAAPHRQAQISQLAANWPIVPNIVTDKQAAFKSARVALAASGTVTLELAVARVPMVALYLLDPIARRMTFLIEIWTASLPNLIADYVVVPEDHDENVWAERLARQLQRLFDDTHERRAQLAGFDLVAERMAVPKPAGVAAAEIILEMARPR